MNHNELGNWGSAKKICFQLENKVQLYKMDPFFFSKNVDFPSFWTWKSQCWHPPRVQGLKRGGKLSLHLHLLELTGWSDQTTEHKVEQYSDPCKLLQHSSEPKKSSNSAFLLESFELVPNHSSTSWTYLNVYYLVDKYRLWLARWPFQHVWAHYIFGSFQCHTCKEPIT